MFVERFVSEFCTHKFLAVLGMEDSDYLLQPIFVERFVDEFCTHEFWAVLGMEDSDYLLYYFDWRVLR
jgi:hypothetical protein